MLTSAGFAVVSATVCVGSAQDSSESQTTQAERSAGIEEIYVLRSLRQARKPADEFCAEGKIGFSAKLHDSYVFKSVVTNASDGKVVDAISHQAGNLNACFDGAPGAAETNFYAEGKFAGVSATGKGKCTPIAADFPEPGITSVRCFLVLSHLPKPYVAGVLTTNSVTSRQPIGAESNPPGYLQPSIATVRLWRRP
jgi:hypothetical protein